MAVMGLTFLVSGCSNSDSSLLAEIMNPGDTVSLSADIQPVFTARCATSGCHSGLFPQENLNLEASRIFDPVLGIIDVESVQRPSMSRVASGDSEMSYLIHKIQGSHLAVGGSGDRMPAEDEPLDDATILAIRQWIDDGAMDN